MCAPIVSENDLGQESCCPLSPSLGKKSYAKCPKWPFWSLGYNFISPKQGNGGNRILVWHAVILSKAWHLSLVELILGWDLFQANSPRLIFLCIPSAFFSSFFSAFCEDVAKTNIFVEFACRLRLSAISRVFWSISSHKHCGMKFARDLYIILVVAIFFNNITQRLCWSQTCTHCIVNIYLSMHIWHVIELA